MSPIKQISRLMLGFYKHRKQTSSDIGLENCLAAARTTAKRTKYCLLVTRSVGRWPSARLVEPISDVDELSFFIGTNPSSRKIREIDHCPQVTLAFGNESENANLIIYGTAWKTGSETVFRATHRQ